MTTRPIKPMAAEAGDRTVKGQTEKKVDPSTKQLTRYGRDLASLLWQKTIADSTPETRRMLFTWSRLIHMAESVLPENELLPRYRHLKHEDVLREVQKAETLLTGATPDMFSRQD